MSPRWWAASRVGRAVVVPYVDALRAEILLREGKAEEGRALMKEVQARLRALPGPDAWTQALFRLDAFARVARDVGDWDLAEYTALQMIDHDAAYGGSHLALGAGGATPRRCRSGAAGSGCRAQVLEGCGSRPQGACAAARGVAAGQPPVMLFRIRSSEVG